MNNKDITQIAIIVIIAVIASNITMLYILRTIPFIHSNDFIAIAVALIGIMVTFAIAYQIFNSLNLNKEIEKQNKYIEAQKRYYSRFINNLISTQNKKIEDLISQNKQLGDNINNYTNDNEHIKIALAIVHAKAKCGLKYTPNLFPDIVLHIEEMTLLYGMINEYRLKSVITLLKTEYSILEDFNKTRSYSAIITDILNTIITVIKNNMNSKDLEPILIEISILTGECDTFIHSSEEINYDRKMKVLADVNDAISNSLQSEVTIKNMEFLIAELTKYITRIEKL